MSNDLTTFEIEVLRYLLEGEDPVLAALREQLQVAYVTSRELTGVGFYLSFGLTQAVVPLHARLQVKLDFCFGDVHAEIASIERGAGFLLWIKEGYLDFLEGYTYDEPWPPEIRKFRLEYVANSNGKRDWSYLREQWSPR